MTELTHEEKVMLNVGANVYAKAMEIACGMATKIELGRFVLKCQTENHVKNMDKLARNSIIQEVIDRIKSLDDPILTLYPRGPTDPPGNAYLKLGREAILMHVETMLNNVKQ